MIFKQMSEVRVLIQTMGEGDDDEEHTYPPGSIGTVLFDEKGRVHIAIGEGDKQIVQVFEDEERKQLVPLNAFTVRTAIKPDLIADMVTGAFEGPAITYWCAKARPVEPCEDCVTYEDKCPWYARASLYEGPFKIRLQQHEEHEDGAGIDVFMTPESVQKGLDLMAEEHPSHFSDMVSGNWDGNTADVFIQLCVFGAIIYG